MTTNAASSIDKTPIPGPRAMPIFGPSGNVIRFAGDFVGNSNRLFKRYGDIFILVQGGGTRLISSYDVAPGTIYVRGPKLLHDISTKSDVFHEFPLSGPLYPRHEFTERTLPLQHWGAGLFAINGDIHRQHRRLMLPAFHKKRIETYRGDMVLIVHDVLDHWRVGEQRNIHNDLLQLFMKITTKTLFGSDISTDGEAVGHAIEESMRLYIAPTTLAFPYDLPGTTYRKFLDCTHVLDKTLSALVAAKQAKGADDGDMLSMLIQSQDEDGSGLSADELLAHAMVLFVAGHETSANASAWTLLLLSQHPTVAANLFEELNGVLHGDSPTIHQLDQLPLLDRVIKESLRILPPLPAKPRVVAQDTELNGYFVPAKSEVIAGIYATHHLPELYPNPEDFNPDRWVSFEPDPFTYHPFGAGPRMCIGAPFAIMSIKIVLATLLQRYRLQFVPNTRIDRKWAITMSPKQGLPMFVNAQDRQFQENVGGLRGNIREMVNLPN